MYQLRPMNCPFHIAVYKHKQYSYRDLPLRYAELGTVYRYERSGTMHGLFRVRGFTQVHSSPCCSLHVTTPNADKWKPNRRTANTLCLCVVMLMKATYNTKCRQVEAKQEKREQSLLVCYHADENTEVGASPPSLLDAHKHSSK